MSAIEPEKMQLFEDLIKQCFEKIKNKEITRTRVHNFVVVRKDHYAASISWLQNAYIGVSISYAGSPEQENAAYFNIHSAMYDKTKNVSIFSTDSHFLRSYLRDAVLMKMMGVM